MRVEIENGKLVAAINFMYDLKLARKHSRFRRHFITLMNNRLKVVEEDRKELLKEHSHKDSKGEAIVKDGQYDVRDMVAFSNDLKELHSEKMVIEGGDNREMIRTIKHVLKKFEDVEYEAQASDIYDYLCEQFGVDEDEEEEKGAEE
jgi:activator of HSP90 ATPase